MNYRLIGDQVRNQRVQKCFSQEKLAEIIHVSPTYVGAIERARKRPSLTTLVNLANALGTTADFLLHGNLWHDTVQYKREFSELLQDCSPYERYMIVTLAKMVKVSLRQGKELLQLNYE